MERHAEGAREAEARAAPVVVVGAGAAGLLAAIASAERGAPTLLVDRRRKIGAKILISGGTRCNVTNAEVREADYNTPSAPFVRNVLAQYPPERVLALLARHGVALKLEPTGKYFPESDSARDVLAALLRALDASGAELRRELLVTCVRPAGRGFVVETDRGPIDAGAVVLCTGGLSYPETGSDGTGYAIARELGHSVARTSPALTPLLSSSREHAALAGLTLPAVLTLWVGGRKSLTRAGSFLFTHKGYSGPVALDVSRHWVRRGWGAEVELRASFVPGLSPDDVEREWLDAARRAPHRKAASLLASWVPQRLAETVAAAGDSPDLTLGRATRAQRLSVLSALADARLPVTGVAGYGKAEVTAGGVALDEVVARTLASKRQPGLFLAGEILDVDGYIGGFNFQWAWSSGWVAGRSAADRVIGER